MFCDFSGEGDLNPPSGSAMKAVDGTVETNRLICAFVSRIFGFLKTLSIKCQSSKCINIKGIQ